MQEGSYREEYIYLNKEELFGRDTMDKIKEAIGHNNAVGTVVGYYDEDLSIISVSDYLLNNLGYTMEEFEKVSQGSLRNIIDGDVTWAETETFRKIKGPGEAHMYTGDGTSVVTRMYKEDSIDYKGEPIWILAVGADWEHENLMLVNEALKSGPWHMDCDKNGSIVRVNWSHAFRKILGYHNVLDFPNTIESWSDLLHPDDREKALEPLYRTIADRTNNTKYNVEYRMRMKDGHYEWHRAFAEVIRRKDGTARRIAGAFVNIEKEKQDERRIKKADAFHQAFTKMNICEYYVDLEHNTFESLKVEPSLLTIFESSTTWDELITAFSDNYVTAEYKDSVKEFYDRKRIEECFNRGEQELTLACPITLDGEERWIRNYVMHGEMEGDQYAMIFLRDITDARKDAAQRREMEESNIAMQHLIKSMVRVVDHFAVCDIKNDTYDYHSINLVEGSYNPRGIYTQFIKTVSDRFKTFEPLESLDICLSPENLRKQIKKPDDVYKFEYCSKEEDVFRMATFVPIEWEDGCLNKVLWTSIDYTAEKQVEITSRKALNESYNAAERANKAKTEFLSNMSHDIRTPMNAIVGLTALAGANIGNQERVLACLEKITKSSRHLLALINEVLDMARIESGKISLSEEDFDLSDLVDNLITMIKPSIEAHGHEFEVSVTNIEHEAVCGDSLRIQQVFTNLMSNAVKYTPDGGHIKLAIEEMPNVRSGLGCFRFTIEDDGIGMSREFQRIMFQPFSREDDHRTGKVQGTGLGMTITRNIVHLMNGTIDVESTLGEGTKVVVTIYLKLQETENNAIKELANLPVLVVDDDIECCESTVTTLKEIGIDGEWVSSGEEAVKLCYERHEINDDYFAIIMDWKMPGMDGIEATRQIRKKVGKDVTIIVLTSYDYSEIEEEARDAGVDAFIVKPLFRSRLTAMLKQLVTGKDEPTQHDMVMEIARADYSGKRILLVEDNDLNREIAREIITMSNVSVDTAENGKEAVEKIAFSPENEYDLVFMDIQMPVMNGYEATAAIRALGGKRGSVPIVAMTANAFAEDVQMAKNTGMNGHIAKPLSMSRLNEVLREWMYK